MALQLLHKRRSLPNPALLHLFSSSSGDSGNSDDKPTRSKSNSLTDYLKDVRSSLRSPPQPPPPRLRGAPPTADAPPPTSPPSLEEIRKNLNSFVSAPSATPFRSSIGRGAAAAAPDGGGDAVRPSFLSGFKSFRLSDANARRFPPPPPKPGVTASVLPADVFGKELEEAERERTMEEKMEFVKPYENEKLGERLRELRPVKREDDKEWFSMEELSERLIKLREIDVEELEKRKKWKKDDKKIAVEDLRNALSGAIVKPEDIKSDKHTNILMLFGEEATVPSYMNLPPKEQLLEIYNHPDNMSAAEKMKIELAKVRDEFKMSESDCGSTRVQVALLTTKIKYLSSALHKKDKHSRKGLVQMVDKRKKLLKYLRRTDWESYCLVLDKLGIRDVKTT